jgi:hypothetical protein
MWQQQQQPLESGNTFSRGLGTLEAGKTYVFFCEAFTTLVPASFVSSLDVDGDLRQLVVMNMSL